MISILTILVISLAIVITAQNATKDSEKKSESAINYPTEIPSQTPTHTLSPTPITHNQPTGIPPTSTPTNTPTQPTQPNSDFQYPGSTLIERVESTTIFESIDDPKKITDWYKDKIKSMNMNVTSFIQTSTNGKVLNKLAGTNGKTQARVEIEKQENSQIVKISASVY